MLEQPPTPTKLSIRESLKNNFPCQSYILNNRLPIRQMADSSGSAILAYVMLVVILLVLTISIYSRMSFNNTYFHQ